MAIETEAAFPQYDARISDSGLTKLEYVATQLMLGLGDAATEPELMHEDIVNCVTRAAALLEYIKKLQNKNNEDTNEIKALLE